MSDGLVFIEGTDSNITGEAIPRKGVYVNPGADSFLETIRSDIYVDKTLLLKYTNSVIETKQKYICFSRPRRFGKTTAAEMLSAYYDRNVDAEKIFKNYKIYEDDSFDVNRNHYDVIMLNMQDFLSRADNIDHMLNHLTEDVGRELIATQSGMSFYDEKNLSRICYDINRETGNKFVIIIDEWDCIFREKKSNREAQEKYLDFLREWLKDKNYVALAYMTGILPIKKYGTHSALNMFDEFSMEDPGVLAEYVGFTESEVLEECKKREIDFEECKTWYDGYHFSKCKSVYNPRSVIMLLRSGIFSDYWNKTETYEALKVYINFNYDQIKDYIISMMAEERKAVDTGSFSNDMSTFSNVDDIMTLLIHLGYLGYDIESKQAFVPNKEIMQEFITATTDSGWDEIVKSIGRSKELLEATINMEEKKVAEYIEEAHINTSHIQYNDENALSYTIALAYYYAKGDFNIVRELPTGLGYADIVLLPRTAKYKCAMIIELKWNKDAMTAIRQIKEKKYLEALRDYKGKLLLVGINYDKKTKKHTCKIEEHTW